MARTGYNKYHNKRGGGFDSKTEKDRWLELQWMQRAGIISGLQRQVRFELIPAQYRNKKCVERSCCYIADFVYYKDGDYIVEDSKGFKTAEYKIKRKLMLWRYGIQVLET